MNSYHKHISLVSGIYYYLLITVLAVVVALSMFWQLETDKTLINKQEITVLSIHNQRNFYIPISFCNTRIQEFEIQRYYHNVLENIYYSVPTARFPITKGDETGCYNTLLTAHTGALEPGLYEYRVFISYNINPIQKSRRLAAIAHVTVE